MTSNVGIGPGGVPLPSGVEPAPEQQQTKDVVADAVKAAHVKAEAKLTTEVKQADAFVQHEETNRLVVSKDDLVRANNTFRTAFSPEVVQFVEKGLGAQIDPSRALSLKNQIVNDPAAKPLIENVKAALEEAAQRVPVTTPDRINKAESLNLPAQPSQSPAPPPPVNPPRALPPQQQQPQPPPPPPPQAVAPRTPALGHGTVPGQTSVPGEVTGQLVSPKAPLPTQPPAKPVVSPPLVTTAQKVPQPQGRAAPPPPQPAKALPTPPLQPAAPKPLPGSKTAPGSEAGAGEEVVTTPEVTADRGEASGAASQEEGGSGGQHGGGGNAQPGLTFSPLPVWAGADGRNNLSPTAQKAAISLNQMTAMLSSQANPEMALVVLMAAIEDVDKDLQNAQQMLKVRHLINDAMRSYIDSFNEKVFNLGDTHLEWQRMTFTLGYDKEGNMYVQSFPDLTWATGTLQHESGKGTHDISPQEGFQDNVGALGMHEAQGNGSLQEVDANTCIGLTAYRSISGQTAQAERDYLNSQMSSMKESDEQASMNLQNLMDTRKQMLQQFAKIWTARSDAWAQQIAAIVQ